MIPVNRLNSGSCFSQLCLEDSGGGARNPADDVRGTNFRTPALFRLGVAFKKEEGEVDALSLLFSKAAKAAPNLDETPFSRLDMVNECTRL